MKYHVCISNHCKAETYWMEINTVLTLHTLKTLIIYGKLQQPPDLVVKTIYLHENLQQPPNYLRYAM